jgi:hypothetical protein
VNPVVLGEGDGYGRVEGELVRCEVGELLLLGVDGVEEGVQLGGGQQHAGVVLPHHTLTLHAHLGHLHMYTSSSLYQCFSDPEPSSVRSVDPNPDLRRREN